MGETMGIQAELKALVARAEAGDAAAADAAARRAGSIRDVLAGARAATDHPDVRAALEDGLEAAEAAVGRIEELLSAKRRAEAESGAGAGAAAPETGGAAGPEAGAREAGPRWSWPPSEEVIGQAAEGLEKLAANVTNVLGQLAKELSRAADEFTRGPSRCRKCGTPLGEARFCPRCGTARG
jgi:hypothetical protein